MPTRRSIKWNGYEVQIVAERRDVPRWLPFFDSIIPYFWDTDINLDMIVTPPKSLQRTTQTTLQYDWKLYDSDDNAIKSGSDSCSLKPSFGKRKLRTMKIGHLKPQQCYRLTIILRDMYGVTSDPLEAATFTIKDRDEFYMQVLIALTAIIMGIILGFVLRGCS